MAFSELNKIQLRPFLMRIWGQAEGAEAAGEATAATAAAATTTEGATATEEEAKVGGPDEAAASGAAASTKDFQPGDLLKGINIPDAVAAAVETPPGPKEGTVEFEFAVRGKTVVC